MYIAGRKKNIFWNNFKYSNFIFTFAQVDLFGHEIYDHLTYKLQKSIKIFCHLLKIYEKLDEYSSNFYTQNLRIAASCFE